MFNLLEKKINIVFKDKNVLKTAFVHRSYLNENKKFTLPSNERLEFLGDSVLSLITAVYLYKNYSQLKEGEYTEIKSAIVKTESLAEAARRLGLGKYLFLSKGEEKEGGRTNKNILADCFEALIGAIFLDKNFETAYKFVIEYLFKNKIDYIVKNRLYLSNKTRLQEILQAKYKKIPEYRILMEKGPDHKKIFTVGIFFNNKFIVKASGGSKKEAEEKAAGLALKKILSMV
ncbi:MAG: ribonuclease III [Microgenomates group bacterium]